MNNTTQTALATAVTAATEALEAAQKGQLTEARQLLTIVDEQLALGEGGNAAAARRGKILRLQAETQALIDAVPVETEPVEPEPTEEEEAPVDALANLPLPAAERADKAPRKAAAPGLPDPGGLGPGAGRTNGAGRRPTEA